MKNDHFVLVERGELWYWCLWGHGYPAGPSAKSGQGYTTKVAAKRSMESARSAMQGAFDDDGKPKIRAGRC